MGAVFQWLGKHWGKCSGGFILIAIVAGIAIPRIEIITRFRTDTPFELAHKRAINTFVDSQGFGIRRMAQDPPDKYWAEMSFTLDGQSHQIRSVSLIGTTKEFGPRLFTSHNPPFKEKIQSAKTRELTQMEDQAIAKLRSKASSYVVYTSPPVEGLSGFSSKVIAPMFARQECLKCHDSEVGELLGAFLYETFFHAK